MFLPAGNRLVFLRLVLLAGILYLNLFFNYRSGLGLADVRLLLCLSRGALLNLLLLGSVSTSCL